MLKPSQIYDAAEFAGAGLSDSDIAVLLDADIRELQEPYIQHELLKARTRTIADLAKAAVQSAINSGDGAEVRQVLKLFNRDLGGDDAVPQRPAILVERGSVGRALEKQREVLSGHKFDPLGHNS